MKVLTVIVFLFFLVHLLALTIEIEPNELNQVSEILQEYINTMNLQQLHHRRRFSILPFVVSTSKGIIQMVVVMATLVGANLLSIKLEPFVSKHVQVNMTVSSATNTTLNQTNKTCEHDHDYGCNKNICWRTCNEVSAEYEKYGIKWCHTSATMNGTTFQPCTVANDCSPCWSCASQCSDGHGL